MYVIKSNRKTNSYTVRKINRVTQVVRVGRRGLQGETGPQGPKGDQGDPATNLVQSVNGKQGVVVLNSTDVGADPTGSASQALQDAKDYTDTEVSTLDSSLATVAKTGSYNDLSNKPTIPSIAGLATEQYVDNGLATKVDKEVGKGLSANDYTTLEKNKLAGIANNATANQTDSYLLNRTNHTGTQAQSTITNLTTDLAAKANASDTVNLTGNQTIAGVKTFSSSPVVPTATTGTQAVNKAQMDTADALRFSRTGGIITGGTVIQYTGDVSLGIESTTPTTGKRYYIISAGSGNFGIQDARDVKTPFRIMTDAPGSALDVVASGINIQGRGILYGTGFPNGVVSAPVGSIYIDTAVTNGASSWIKKSGTGNTGWQVLEGDTGARSIPITNGIGAGTVVRVGNIVSFNFAGFAGDGPYGETELLNLPIGFRPPVNTLGLFGQGGGIPNKLMDIRLNGKVTLWSGVVSGQSMRSLGSLYITTDPWPTTLP